MTEKQKQWSAIIAAVVLGLSVTVYKIYTTLIPSAAEYIANKIPNEIYKKIGESSLISFDSSEFSKSKLTPAKQAEVQKQYNELLVALNLPIELYTLHFRSWKGQVNAMALMDKSVVVTDSLINTLHSKQQIQSILLHEIGHIEHNHLMENTLRVSLFYISLSFIFGDISLVSDLLIEGSTMNVKLSYSRDFELEADLFSAEKLTELYGNSDALLEVFTIFESNAPQDHELQWLHTHPSFNKRIESIKNTSIQH